MNKVEQLPTVAGVYKFFNKNNELIYIGKAKNIRKRVSSYFKTGSHKSEQFKSYIHNIEYIVTKSEVEALLLEINLIKTHKPRFNVIFKDDKTFPYICVLEKNGELKVETRRAKLARLKNCYGPYPNGSKAFQLTRVIEEAYKLRKCLKKNQERCLYAQLGQCLHIEGKEKALYIENAKEDIISLLKGNINKIETFIFKKIQIFSDFEEYELAGKYKSILKKIREYDSKQTIYSDNIENADYVGYYTLSNRVAIFITHVRGGKIISTFDKIYKTLSDVKTSLQNFLITFYDINPAPSIIYLDREVYDKTLSLLNLEIKVPLIGKKRRILDLSMNNALEVMKKNKIQVIKEKELFDNWKHLASLAKLKELYSLEIYDASHISGEYYVGAKVEFIQGKYNSKRTRKFNLSELSRANDTKALALMLEKRFKNDKTIPDLIIVDGSVAQLNCAKKTLETLSINIPIIGLVKNDKHKTDHILLETGEVLYFENNSFKNMLARFQEKVHHIAIKYHKSKRRNKSIQSWLDDIKGVGPKTKQKLLFNLGSIKNIKKSSVEELQKIVSKRVAQNIINKII